MNSLENVSFIYITKKRQKQNIEKQNSIENNENFKKMPLLSYFYFFLKPRFQKYNLVPKLYIYNISHPTLTIR